MCVCVSTGILAAGYVCVCVCVCVCGSLANAAAAAAQHGKHCPALQGVGPAAVSTAIYSSCSGHNVDTLG